MVNGKFFRRRGGVKPRTGVAAAPKTTTLARKAQTRRKPYIRRAPLKMARSRVPRPYGKMSAPLYAHPLNSHEFFDPLDKRQHGLPSPDSIGEHLVLDGVCRQGISTLTTAPVYIVYQWTASNLQLFSINGGSGVITQYSVPQLATANPTAVRPMRASLRLRNTTVFTSLQGTIRSLSSPQQFEWEFSANQTLTAGALTSLANMMNSHPSVRSYSQSEMTKTKAWVVPPASVDGFQKYSDFVIPLSGPTGDLIMINGAQQVAQNILIVQLNATTVIQTMDVALHVQVAARFPNSSLYSNLTQDPVRISADRYNSHIHKLQKSASEGVDHEELEDAKKRGSSSLRSVPY